MSNPKIETREQVMEAWDSWDKLSRVKIYLTNEWRGLTAAKTSPLRFVALCRANSAARWKIVGAMVQIERELKEYMEASTPGFPWKGSVHALRGMTLWLAKGGKL